MRRFILLTRLFFPSEEMIEAVLDSKHSKNAKFDKIHLENASFRKTNLCCMTFDGTNLSKPNMLRIWLVRALFRNANLTKANLSHVNLYDKYGYWNGGVAILTQARFIQANFF